MERSFNSSSPRRDDISDESTALVATFAGCDAAVETMRRRGKSEMMTLMFGMFWIIAFEIVRLTICDSMHSFE